MLQSQRARALRRVLLALGPREREVLAMAFGIDRRPRTLSAIGRRLGLSRQRVSQIRDEEIRRLRRPPVLKLLKDYA